MKRKRRQKGKYLGRRFFGRGNVKNARGSGNRGGRGNAGLAKHKRTYIAAYEPDYFGKHGFKNPTKTKLPVMHLYDVNKQAFSGKLQKSDTMFTLTFSGKILSTGGITIPVKIRALAWSKKAEEKIKQAGGEITKLEKN
jgi:large subunit ribosomal protein L15